MQTPYAERGRVESAGRIIAALITAATLEVTDTVTQPQARIPEDVYGPQADRLLMWAIGLGTGLCAYGAVICRLSGRSLLLSVGYGLMTVLLLHAEARALWQRRVRARTYRHGMPLQATVIGKKEALFNGMAGAVNPRMYLTVRYELHGVSHEVTSRVTDGVFFRWQVGNQITVRVLPERPEVWVPAA